MQLQAPSVLTPVLNPAQVTEVARYAAGFALQLGLDEAGQARAAAVAQAAGNNLLNAGGGELFVGTAGMGPSYGVQILALDRSRGLTSPDPDAANGSAPASDDLSAIERSATSFDVYSAGDGTVLAATIYREGIQPLPVGALSIAARRQTACGDGWSVWTAGELTSLFVCDGVGVGAEASAAARVALEAFGRQAARSAEHVVAAVHEALRGTRGASVALAELDYRSGTLRYCALGSITGTVITPDATQRPLATVRGIAGQVVRPLRVVAAPWTPGSTLVLHSSGLSKQWSLSRYPGLKDHRPDVIAGVLLRDHKQSRDDATIVIARNPADA